MNQVWIFMLLSGIFFFGLQALGVTNGTAGSDGFMQGMLASCEEAVTFVISLAGVMGMWSGFMNVARGSGLMQQMAERSAGLMRFLFPGEKDHETLMLMLMGFAANIFGAGNSATVFSLQAMKRLDRENGGGETASDEMCMFAAVNMSMLQLVPITVIQVRAAAGASAPEDIIFPSVLAGTAATLGSVFFCKWCAERGKPLHRYGRHG